MIYAKRDDPSVVIEHFGGKWIVKTMSDFGTDNCYAAVESDCALEACTSHGWLLWDESAGWNDAPDVKMVTGKVAERQVRGSFRRA